MTRLTVPVFAALVATGAAGCGGESTSDYRSEISCEDLCAKSLVCDPDTDVASCESGCEASKDVIRGSVLDAMATCMIDLPCNSQQAQTCVENAVASAPSGGTESFIRSMCSKAMECAGGAGSIDYCVMEIKERAGDALSYFDILKTSVLSCLSDCYHGLDCDQIQNDEEALDQCGRQCGIADLEIP
jgi:hypothetical protein